ncbi:MAG: GTP-binding protein [Proteobacteria bacterium]|nr:GTP-binding protein [Pseudomonadota bacterium]
MPPLPVTVLTGFLGAGKTTILRRLLDAPHGRRVGVILNELGQTGIDDVAGAARQQAIELSNGCVCCVRSPDLLAALTDMQARGDVDLVILETTGVADPLVLTWTLTRPDLIDTARLDAVITVVDAANFDATRTPEWTAQVRCADLVIITKLDLAPGPDARARVEAAVLDAGGTDRFLDGRDPLPLGLLLDLTPDPDALATRAGIATATAHPEARHGGFHAVSLALPAEAIFDASRLEDWLEALPASIFRAKGIVRTGPARWLGFHTVGGRLDVNPSAPAPTHGESRLVFLGPAVDEAAIRADLARCQA